PGPGGHAAGVVADAGETTLRGTDRDVRVAGVHDRDALEDLGLVRDVVRLAAQVGSAPDRVRPEPRPGPPAGAQVLRRADDRAVAGTAARAAVRRLREVVERELAGRHRYAAVAPRRSASPIQASQAFAIWTSRTWATRRRQSSRSSPSS